MTVPVAGFGWAPRQPSWCFTITFDVGQFLLGTLTEEKVLLGFASPTAYTGGYHGFVRSPTARVTCPCTAEPQGARLRNKMMTSELGRHFPGTR